MPSSKKSAAAARPVAIPEIIITPTLHAGAAGANDVAERAATALPALGQALAGPIADFWRNLTRDANLRPDEVELTLGLNLEGGTKWAIVATVSATVEVKMKWGRPPAR